ncbi:MAG TPA: hypothetical protein VK279_01540, partial [Solirubrobacteraceae bacterium]|nr:hypothetical protein [Solirubrobacteraceae bacterium]
MAKFDVLIEVEVEVERAFSRFTAASASLDAGRGQVEELMPSDVAGAVTYRPTAKPIPMFAPPADASAPSRVAALSAFASPDVNDDVAAATQIIPVQAEPAAIDDLRARPGVRVWPNSPITFFVDCRPFR